MGRIEATWHPLELEGWPKGTNCSTTPAGPETMHALATLLLVTTAQG